MTFSLLILTSQGHRAFKIKSTEASRIGLNICQVDFYPNFVAISDFPSTLFETLKKTEMHLISGLACTEKITLTVLKMQKEGLSDGGPVDVALLKDVYLSKLRFYLHLLYF